jgi:hypothetical protein
MFMLLSVAVGGDWLRTSDEKAQLPAAFEVDYVRGGQSVIFQLRSER